ncbi:hypothetical protein NNO_0626 [Hydrogenimonas sp.]|nr:hypothetical protein NNO_0626 [Hydrogenimonas sp.]
MRFKHLAVAAVMAAMPFGLAAGGDIQRELEEMKKRLSELEQKQKSGEEERSALIDELATLQSEGWFQTVDVTKSHSGLGAAASKVYYTQNPLSIGGYGEMYWADSTGGRAITDVYRFVPYIGYKFSDKVVLNTELEFEHGGEKVAVEFLYLDFLLHRNFNLRLGSQLVPVGLVNLRHEPTLFPTVQRPETEKYIIPSTWNETGVVAYGETGVADLYYHFGIVNALNLNTSQTQTGDAGWIRDGRKGSANKTAMGRVAATGRLDYSGIEGLTAGASFYWGNASNDKSGNVNGTSILIYDLHALYSYESVKVKALFTQALLSGAEKISPVAAKKAQGWYVTAEYDIMRNLKSSSSLPLFVQYESYNPVKEREGGATPMNDIDIWTFGVNYYPHEQVVLKADYAVKDRNDGSDKVDTLSFGLGFIF